MPVHLPRLTCAVSVAAALAGGCGGEPPVSLPGPETPTAPLTKVEFLAEANQICRATTQAIVTRSEAAGDRRQLREAAEPVVRLALERLRNLTPPAADRETARQAIDALQAAADAAATDPTVPVDPVGIKRPDLFDFGLTGCFTRG